MRKSVPFNVLRENDKLIFKLGVREWINQCNASCNVAHGDRGLIQTRVLFLSAFSSAISSSFSRSCSRQTFTSFVSAANSYNRNEWTQ